MTYIVEIENSKIINEFKKIYVIKFIYDTSCNKLWKTRRT